MKDKWLIVSLICLAFFATEALLIKVIILLSSMVYCLLHFRRKEWMFALIFTLLITLRVNLVNKEIPKEDEARIIKMSENYVIAQGKRHKIILYNLVDVKLDDLIQFEGEYKKIEQNSSFYNFNYQTWANHQSIYYQMYVKSFKVLQQGHTLRNKIMRKIDDVPIVRVKNFMKQSLFGIDSEAISSDFAFFFISSGMHYSAFLAILRKFLGYLTEEDRVEGILFVVEVFGALCFHFSFIFFRVLMNHLLRFFVKEQKERLGIGSCLCLLYDPYCLSRLSFAFVFMRQLVGCFNPLKGIAIKRFFGFVYIQLIYFKQFLLIQYLLFKPLRFIFGFLYALIWITFIFPPLSIILNILLLNVDWILAQATYFKEFKIVGFPPHLVSFFVLYCLFATNQKQCRSHLLYLAGLLIVMPLMQLYHPFGEVSLINVGQGDSVLIRAPYGKENVLLDTGSLKNYAALKVFLQAKGIRQIDTLIISHGDEDHNGAQEILMKDFKVKEIIDKKQQIFHSSRIAFQFLLSDHQYPENNENSLIGLLTYNQLNFLFLGDIPTSVEKALLDDYPDLKVDIIKLAHHGSKTSTSTRLLTTLKPAFVLISSGLNNRYNHPSKEVIQELDQFLISWLDTQKSGDISIYFTSIFNFIATSEGQFGIIDRVIR